MTMEISQIVNAALRKAAEDADSHGNSNGKLDEAEMSVFVKTAYAGGCAAEDITAITGVETDDENLAKTISDMQAIEKKKAQLEKAEKELKREKQYYFDSQSEYVLLSKGFPALAGICTVLFANSGLERIFIKRYYGQIMANKANKANKMEKFFRVMSGKTLFGSIVRSLGLIAAGASLGILVRNALPGSEEKDFERRRSINIDRHDYKSAKSEVETLKCDVQAMEDAFKAA